MPIGVAWHERADPRPVPLHRFSVLVAVMKTILDDENGTRAILGDDDLMLELQASTDRIYFEFKSREEVEQFCSWLSDWADKAFAGEVSA